MLRWGVAVAGLLVGAAPGLAFAQEVPVEETGEDIVVTGEVRGAVEGDIKPELQLSPADVRAYGVPTIADLLTELAPQTGSGQGRGGDRPVVLLGGRRISSFSEIRDLPTEAIERVDILPEEVALQFGYRADQKVVNIVLRRRFRALTGEIQGRVPTAGGNSQIKTSTDILKISRDARVNLDVQYNRTSGILESERNVMRVATGPVDPDGTDLTPYRTLVQPNEALTINGSYSRDLSSKVNATVNLRLEQTQREQLLGLPSVTLLLPAANPFSPYPADTELFRYLDTQLPLSRDAKERTVHGGISLNGDGLPWGQSWRWSLTGNYDRVTSRSITDTGIDPVAMQALLDANDPAFDPFARIPQSAIVIRPADLANSTSSVGSLDALLTGPLFKMPAGDARLSVRFGGRTSDFESESLRAGIARAAQVSRDSGSAQANFDVPIASRRRGVLDAIGDLSLNANVQVEQLSDFGSLVTTGYGVHWSPMPELRLIASVTDDRNAPSANQLGDPVTSTPNVRVFDYVRGETVDVTYIGGGNPLLRADDRHVLKLGLTLRPLSDTDLTLRADFVSSTIRNQIAGFPGATAAIETAFPGRFVRDTSGRLVSIDNRPVNFDRAERQQLRWGVNFSMPLASSLEKRLRERRAERMRQREEAEKNGTPLPPEAGARRQRAQGDGQPRQQGGFFGGQRGPGGGGGRGFGGRRGGPNGALAGRVQFSLYHTWHLKDQVTIRPGLPVLDLLDGSATGSRGGQPEHEIEARAGVSKDGFGARLSANWQSGTQVATGVLGSGDRLDFSSLATLDLRLFADLGQQLGLVRKHRWLRGTRATLSVDNLFDARQRVTDEAGAVPLSYQPDLLDPTGRTLRLSIRKLFF